MKQFLVFLVLVVCGILYRGDYAWAEQNIPELPYEFSVKWDISKKDNLLVKDFVVNKRDPFSLLKFIFSPIKQFEAKEHGYYICISFRHLNNEVFSSEEWEQLTSFVGSGVLDAHTLQPVPSGLTIPVVIKLERIDGEHVEPFLPEKIIDTTSQIAHSAARYDIDRVIGHLVIPAGRYRISISTPHEVKLPPNVETFLLITHLSD